jgi:hypothetical protein
MTPPNAGDIAIDWDPGLVTDLAGGRTALRAQTLAVLRELHDRAGNLVSKDELIVELQRQCNKICPNFAAFMVQID